MVKWQVTEVEVTVGQPYIAIAGGWSGMRPVGRKRDYTATAFGKVFRNTSKDDIARAIRAAAYRDNGGRVHFTWKEGQS